MEICVVGLGKLGAPLAAVLASKGHNVIGVDLNNYFVDCINAGKAPVIEPQLQELINESKGRMRATRDFKDAIPKSDISFVIVPTPSDETGKFSNRFVLDAVRSIGEALCGSKRYHVVNITSTVMPGSTEGEILQELEKASGKRVGPDIGLTYNPEFIALGSVVRNMLYPDMILLGQYDKRAGDVLENVYRTSTNNEPAIQRMNLVNAEITKISVNTYVTTKISFANMLSGICEKIPGADVSIVTSALGKDTRIGPKYLQAGLGFGGPCFPRDNIAFGKMAEELGARADVALAAESINLHQLDRISVIVKSKVDATSEVAILGMSYKPDTPVVEESHGIKLAAMLAAQGCRVVVYDPIAMEGARWALKDSVRYGQNLEETVRNASTILIATQSREYAEASKTIKKPGVTIIDCWRIFTDGGDARLVHLGLG